MTRSEPFADIHCHLLPGLDDGASSLDKALAMAKMAVADGIDTIVATPHQLGNYAQNSGETIHKAVVGFQRELARQSIPLRVLPGGEVRIEPGMVNKIRAGIVVTLGNHRRHILLELPHEVYLPLDRLLSELAHAGLVGILSHPERNCGILRQPKVLRPLVERGLLLQVTAGSLTGDFGPQIEKLSESLVSQGLVHFVGTDSHGCKSRPPVMSTAFHRVAKIAGESTAVDLCCRNPMAVAKGETVVGGCRGSEKFARSGWFRRTFSSEHAALGTI